MGIHFVCVENYGNLLKSLKFVENCGNSLGVVENGGHLMEFIKRKKIGNSLECVENCGKLLRLVTIFLSLKFS